MNTPTTREEPEYWHVHDVRGLVLAFGALTASATLVLYIMADSTSEYWAWTIDPPITAAFLGAGYLAGLTGLVVLALTRTQQLRLGLMAIFTFVFVTGVATLMHLDPFHLTADDLLPRVVAWIWLIVYVAVPFWILYVVVRLPRDTPTTDTPRLPLAYRVLLWAQGLVLAALGLTMFIFPGTAETLWPWPLSPLTARCVSAWLLFAAVVAFVVARLRGRAGSEVALVVYTLLPLLQGIAMARFHEQMAWDGFAAVLVISLLTLTMLSGLLGFLLVRRSEAGAR